MDRLNCFNPYQSKAGYHEDQLSRNFMVLLRLSFHAFTLFYDLCRDSYNATNESADPLLLALSELFQAGWVGETQRTNPNSSETR